MERISIFDIYKIGVGPSSSHTLGPWKAARAFLREIDQVDIDTFEVELYGSLAKTGKGHGTDIAVQLGLEDHDPKTVDTTQIGFLISRIATEKYIPFKGQNITFDPSRDIHFHPVADPAHPNTLVFRGSKDGQAIIEKKYFSVGGGFVQEEGLDLNEQNQITLPYPIDSGADIVRYTDQEDISFADVVHRNELAFRPEEAIQNDIAEIYNTMLECVHKGCNTDGILPGGLNVKRRAASMSKQLLNDKTYEKDTDWLDAIKSQPRDFNMINKWISTFALAVNEENAALGRVVTSPTNGAAGVIPAVMLYYYFFCDYKGHDDLRRFFFTSGEIGCLFKKGATISAAVGGCQAEIGVSSAMAAAGLTEVLGGTPRQVLMAAEIAMEHHLGLTCDPIGGLVQIPCIERNTMGAMKAITASNLALSSNPDDAIVNFDTVVKTMWDTAQDMNSKYKETAEGGLAFNLPVAFPNC